MTFHIIFGTTLAAILIHLVFTRTEPFTPGRIVEVFLLYLLCIQWGFGAASLAIPHIIWSDQVAEFIVWTAGSPFQVELGFASLGLALVGILCIWIRGWFWLAPVIGQTVFLLGAAYVHIQDIALHDNLSPGNAGSVLFYDIAMPLVGCALFFLHYRFGGIPSSAGNQVSQPKTLTVT